MFTGITHGTFQVNVHRSGDLLQLGINLGTYGRHLNVGASVAINGVCLTVVSIQDKEATFDVASETARITNLGFLQDKANVNVERSFKVGDEVGGHILSGHVAACVDVVEFQRSNQEASMTFQVPERWRSYLITKGFVALNGCSLTIAEFDRKRGIGSVNLIPETLRRTTFSETVTGDRLNLEVDSQTQTIVETVREILRDREWADSVR